MASQKIIVISPDQFSALLEDVQSSMHVAKFHLLEVSGWKDVGDEMLATIAEYYAAIYNLKHLLESQVENVDELFRQMVEHNLEGIPVSEEVVFQINTFVAAVAALKVILKNKYNLSMEVH